MSEEGLEKLRLQQVLTKQEDFENLTVRLNNLIADSQSMHPSVITLVLGQACARYSVHNNVNRKTFLKSMGTCFTFVQRAIAKRNM